MNCPKCGTPIPEGSRYCASCGIQVTDPGAATVLVASDKEQDELLAQLRKALAGEYEVERELGRGGMAVVYKAKEIDLHRSVALKVLPPDIAMTQSAGERFKREARMAAALDHAHIIPIYRVGQAGGLLYIAMKFVEGRALDAVIEQQGALPLPVAVRILRAAASALAYAHERDIVHRDIKGANIMLDKDGRVLVSDFGIARAASDTKLTATGAVIGTPAFMSPEQCAGQRVAAQSDQYSLGIVAFQMLTGAVPFEAESIVGIMQHHFFTPVPDIRGVRSGVPEPLVAIVNRTLAKEPGERYATTRDLVRALDALPMIDAERTEAEELSRELAKGVAVPKVRTASLPPLPDVRTRPVTAPAPAAATPRVPEAKRRRRTGVWAAAGVVVLGGAGAGLWLATRPGPPPPPASPPRSDTALATPPVAVGGTQPRRGAPAETTTRVPRAVVQARRPPAASADTGVVRISAVPATAELFIDGKKVGVGTVFNLSVPAGRHRLRVSVAGYVTFDTTFTVGVGETVLLGPIELRNREGGP